METYVPRKRQRLSSPAVASALRVDDEEDSTDFKLTLLASLHPDRTQDVLLDYLLAYDGSVDRASDAIASRTPSKRAQAAATGRQSSLASFTARPSSADDESQAIAKSLTKRGKTLHLYAPADIEQHTPCSIIHNFLSASDADALVKELLDEMPSFRKDTFQLFDRTVVSPHTFRFYVDSQDEAERQRTEYIYNGSRVEDVGQTPPVMLRISQLVRKAVNDEVNRRIRDFYPNGKKLRFQSPDEWKPNASFVNCYDGGKESVGYHSDQLTYLGPRAVIGSLSLGVAREFRVRCIVPNVDAAAADKQGQIAIHLPHNSLLVMHAEMQEEWKHAIAPAQAIDPHPVTLNKRLNVTYRCYKDFLHPKFTPRCRCNVPAVLRCVQKRAATRGRYMWMCHAGYTPGHTGCSFFTWAEFDEDGRPPWAEGYECNLNTPNQDDL